MISDKVSDMTDHNHPKRYIYLQITTALDSLSLVKLRLVFFIGAVLKQRATDSCTSDKNKTEETVHVRW